MVLKNDKGESYTSLNAFVSDKLYTDSIVNALAKALLPLCEDETVVKVLDIFGVDYSPLAVVAALNDIDTNIYNVMGSGSFDTVDYSKVTWGVKDAVSFSNAIVAILSPFALFSASFLTVQVLNNCRRCAYNS